MSTTTPAGGIIGETVIVDETGQGLFQLQVKAGSSTFTVDEPASVGGKGSGPNPYDLLSAAIGSCTLMTMRLYAKRKGLPLESARVKVTHRRDGADSPDVFHREIELNGPLDHDQRAKLLEIADKCPIHRTLERGSKMETMLVLASTFQDVAATDGAHMRDMNEVCDELGDKTG